MKTRQAYTPDGVSLTQFKMADFSSLLRLCGIEIPKPIYMHLSQLSVGAQLSDGDEYITIPTADYIHLVLSLTIQSVPHDEP
jgi:hypothetical protein